MVPVPLEDLRQLHRAPVVAGAEDITHQAWPALDSLVATAVLVPKVAPMVVEVAVAVVGQQEFQEPQVALLAAVPVAMVLLVQSLDLQYITVAVEVGVQQCPVPVK